MTEAAPGRFAYINFRLQLSSSSEGCGTLAGFGISGKVHKSFQHVLLRQQLHVLISWVAGRKLFLCNLVIILNWKSDYDTTNKDRILMSFVKDVVIGDWVKLRFPTEH